MAETGTGVPSGRHILEVHVPTILLSMIATFAVVAALAAGFECVERLHKWCLRQHQRPSSNVPMATHYQPPPYSNISMANEYEQTTNIHEINEDNHTPRTKRTRTRSTNTKTTKCHKTTNTDDAVSALIAAGNRWAADNKIEG